jgi:hypothetical protein
VTTAVQEIADLLASTNDATQVGEIASDVQPQLTSINAAASAISGLCDSPQRSISSFNFAGGMRSCR